MMRDVQGNQDFVNIISGYSRSYFHLLFQLVSPHTPQPGEGSNASLAPRGLEVQVHHSVSVNTGGVRKGCLLLHFPIRPSVSERDGAPG